MTPAVGSSAPRTSLEVVVFPHPDSPTRPSVSPPLILKLMPSTALTQPCGRPSKELPTGKCFLRSRTSSSGSPIGGPLGEPAPYEGPLTHPMLLRLVAAAAFDRAGTPRVKAAPGGQRRQVRRLTGDRVQRLLGAKPGNR